MLFERGLLQAWFRVGDRRLRHWGKNLATSPSSIPLRCPAELAFQQPDLVESIRPCEDVSRNLNEQVIGIAGLTHISVPSVSRSVSHSTGYGHHFRALDKR